MKKIAFAKIHFGLGLLVLLFASAVPAALFSSLYFFAPQNAQALIGSDISIQVISPPIPCVQDELSPTCTESCIICGDLASICIGAFEVKAKFLKGVNLLHHQSALCLRNPVPPKRGTFRPGVRCAGKIIYNGLHTLNNFACGGPI